MKELATAIVLYLAAREDYQHMVFLEGYIWTIFLIGLAANGLATYMMPVPLATWLLFTLLGMVIYHYGYWEDGDAMMYSAIAFVHPDFNFMIWYSAMMGIIGGIFHAASIIEQLRTYPHKVLDTSIPYLPVMFFAYVFTVATYFFL